MERKGDKSSRPAGVKNVRAVAWNCDVSVGSRHIVDCT